jgi:drug/metabolite transporter (DMT)-like permease
MAGLASFWSTTGTPGATHMKSGVIPMLVFFVLCNTGGEIAMSYGMKQVGEPQGFRPMALLRFVLTAAKNRWLWLAIPMLAASFYSLLILFSWEKVSVVIPATASNFIVGTFAAKYLLKEDVSSKRWLGVLCVAVGVLIVLRSGGH